MIFDIFDLITGGWHGPFSECPLGSLLRRVPCPAHNKSMQRTALRAAADAERSS